MHPEGKTGTLVGGKVGGGSQGSRYQFRGMPAVSTKLTRGGGSCRGNELLALGVCGSSSWGPQWRFLYWVGVAVLNLLLCTSAQPQICLEQQEGFFHSTGERKSISF